jgi:2-dehydro-3-deoxygalactonokinase
VTFAQDFLAIDWGTTNRRIVAIRDGAPAEIARDDRGVTTIAPGGFEAELAAVRTRMGDLPVLMAGMVGSTLGWRETPYLPVPARLDELAANLLWLDARTAIVPGLSFATPEHCDVMRGEEVQLLGAVAGGLCPADALLAQPGTHCKWATVAGGRITGFVTAMTGELFALLRREGVLARQLGGAVTLSAAFHDGVAAGRRRDLLASLFEIRAAKLLGRRDDADAASYASGLLIGADVAARLGDHRDVHLIADAPLGPLYAAAVNACGGTPHLIDSQAAFVAGITRIGALA